MENSENQAVMPSPPSLVWGWFHCGAIDLVFSFAYFIIGLIYLTGLKPFSTWLQSLSSTAKLILFLAAMAVFLLLVLGGRLKIAAMLSLRVKKEDQKLTLADKVSTYLRYLIVAGMLGATFSNLPEQQVLVTFLLLMLLLASYNAIRVRYHYFWFIFVIGCILLTRSYLEWSILGAFGRSSYMTSARFLIVGASFCIVSLLRLKKFMAAYPIIGEGQNQE